jgi:hypothetical protein
MGRKSLDGLAPSLGEHSVPIEIEPAYWQDAEFAYTFFADHTNSRPQTHIWGPNKQGWPIYTDLCVNRAQAESVLPALLSRQRLSAIEKKIGAFWDEGNALSLATDHLANETWANKVETYLTGVGLLDEAVMFKTLPAHKDKMNKLRRIWGRAAHRARHD